MMIWHVSTQQTLNHTINSLILFKYSQWMDTVCFHSLTTAVWSRWNVWQTGLWVSAHEFCHIVAWITRPFVTLLFLFYKNKRNNLVNPNHTVQYLNLLSAIKPVPHDEDLPVLLSSIWGARWTYFWSRILFPRTSFDNLVNLTTLFGIWTS